MQKCQNIRGGKWRFPKKKKKITFLCHLNCNCLFNLLWLISFKVGEGKYRDELWLSFYLDMLCVTPFPQVLMWYLHLRILNMYFAKRNVRMLAHIGSMCVTPFLQVLMWYLHLKILNMYFAMRNVHKLAHIGSMFSF